jgi:hypothetical protein
MDDLTPRLRAVCDLSMAEAREYAGRHEYDGQVQDLSRAGVTAGLAALAATDRDAPQDDAFDEAHLGAAAAALRVAFGDLELHRRDPGPHLENLDLACYDREYAPAAQRDAARRAHLAAWPAAIDAAIDALDQVSAPVADALSGGIAGLAAGIPADADPADADRALAAHRRLVAVIEQAKQHGSPDAALGAAGLTALMSSAEAMPVDLGQLGERADAERDRLLARLAESCARVDPRAEPFALVHELVREHPDIDGVLAAARTWTQRVIDFTAERDLVPDNSGECRVGLAPESRRWAMAMMSPAAPGEPDGPSWYHIVPPEPDWPASEIEEWLAVFSDTTLPAITAHEVAPGHFSHGRALRAMTSPVRRTLHSAAFVEGWAHYAEELFVEEGFCADDPRFAIGVWVEALIRVTRLACAIGVHTAGMSVAEATRRFESDTHLTGVAAASEARRATFDPTYGRYTWGKLEIMDLRERARKEWGQEFSLKRFHAAMLALGSPPLGLLHTAVDRG